MRIRIPFTNFVIRASMSHPKPWSDAWWGLPGALTASGIEVSEKTALKFSPVYAAVKRISESIASLPLNLYRISGRNKEKATDNPLYRILHLQPNPEQTRIQMWEALQSHLLLWGNCYAQIERNLGGKIIALWPLDPSRMTSKRENGILFYEYRMTDGEIVRFPFWEILHIAGLSFNGLTGYSVIGLMRETIGLGKAQEEFASRFYANGGAPIGALETDGSLDDDGIRDLRKWWRETYGDGVSKSQQVLILQQGLKFHALSIPQKDAQFLETRKFTVRDVARWFLIPPHMIGDLERATWGNIESQGIDYVVYTLRPWLVRLEQGMEVKFGLGDEYQIRHVVEGLLRGDSAARAALYNSAITNGWMSRNEVRILEDLNPQEGLDGFLVSANTIATGSEDAATTKSPDGKNGKGDEAFQKKMFEYMARTSREVGDIRKRLAEGAK